MYKRWWRQKCCICTQTYTKYVLMILLKCMAKQYDTGVKFVKILLKTTRGPILIILSLFALWRCIQSVAALSCEIWMFQVYQLQVPAWADARVVATQNWKFLKLMKIFIHHNMADSILKQNKQHKKNQNIKVLNKWLHEVATKFNCTSVKTKKKHSNWFTFAKVIMKCLFAKWR